MASDVCGKFRNRLVGWIISACSTLSPRFTIRISLLNTGSTPKTANSHACAWSEVCQVAGERKNASFRSDNIRLNQSRECYWRKASTKRIKEELGSESGSRKIPIGNQGDDKEEGHTVIYSFCSEYFDCYQGVGQMIVTSL